jgi:tRNA(fMet)-specific endonuclease VapC
VTLSIDTNVFVELIRGRNALVRRRFELALAANEPLVASLIVLQELLFGVEIDPRSAAQRRSVRLALAQVDIQPFDEGDMTATAQLRARLRLRGLSIGAYDALVAGQALARDWTVVTANTREFARVEGLKVIDWTAPAD